VRWLSSPSNSIVPEGRRWLPRSIARSERASRTGGSPRARGCPLGKIWAAQLGVSRGTVRVASMTGWDALTEQHELVWWLPIILVALLAINAMFRSSRRPREPAPPRRFSLGRRLLAALFPAGLVFLVKWGR
jgi:hypothetical protein